MSEMSEQLDDIDRMSKMSREANEAIMNGHLEASAMVVAQLGALVAQGLVKRPDFTAAEAA